MEIYDNLFKTLLGVFLAAWILLSVTESAGQTFIHPTVPGTGFRDYFEPSLVIEDDGTVYQTIPGTNFRDYDEPGYGTNDGELFYQTVPGTDFPDYFEPGFIIEQD